ncbi:MAG: putative oxidoreductase [Parvicella sp.]|jgi:putative oxidoreductase
MVKKYLISLLQSSKDKGSGLGFLMLRIGTSTLMVYLHGWPKLKNYSEGQNSLPELIGLGSESGLLLAIFAEVICSFLLALGLLTRLVVIPLSFTMVVAAFVFNADQALIVKEKAILYLIVYLFLLVTGAGKYSIDHLLAQKISSKKQ